MASRQAMAAGSAGAVYVNETQTKQRAAQNVVQVNETVATTATRKSRLPLLGVS